MTAHKPDLSWMTLFLAVVSHSSDVGSIPIARSGNPVDAVGFTGFLHPKLPLKTRVLDAVGRGFRPSGHLGRDTHNPLHNLHNPLR